MNQKTARKPIGNFFIKKSLQLRLVSKIVLAAIVSTLISSGSLLLVYYLKYQTVIVYQLDKYSQELTRDHLVYLILPTLLISSVVSLLVSLGVGLYSSRKYAVPIYKLEQWATLLSEGKMSVLLRFREKEEMRDLSDKCNQLTEKLRTKFSEIRKISEMMKQSDSSCDNAKQIDSILSDIELESDPIEVKTQVYSVSKTEK
ncbi:MAG TPA: hypothetical protein VKY57_11430 [Chitinispirillaceae bacterium]|jgi:methyl-accepting chemotaxis protein|nr:hypothetical protein [Chitinispirillaceae bacterium]